MKISKISSRRDLLLRACAALCLALTLAFIFGNSMLPGEASGEASSGMCEFINRFLSIFSDAKMDEHLLRKLAHFGEFFILGISCSALQLLSFLPIKPRIIATCAAALTAAVADELIQFTSAGRTPRVTDVLIDLAGITFGVIVLNLIRNFISGKKKTQHESKSGI